MKITFIPGTLFTTFTIVVMTGFLQISDISVCEIQLPENGTWTGKAFLGDTLHLTNTSVTIAKTGENTFLISDFSAGILKEGGYSYDNPMTITIDCNNQVIHNIFNTPFGDCEILTGNWDDAQDKLTITWKIPVNFLDETTTFEPNN